MVYAVSGTLGADLNNRKTAAELAQIDQACGGDNKLGQQAWGDDGKLYVYAQANAAITASTAVCTVSPTTFLVTATGGAYTSPAQTMASGDRGWFGKASV